VKTIFHQQASANLFLAAQKLEGLDGPSIVKYAKKKSSPKKV
jgi:hypothetical protein